MTNNMIEVTNLGKKYNLLPSKVEAGSLSDKWLKKLTNNGQREKKKADFWALEKVNFSLEKGKKLGVIGPNGAGKSTLLKILSRITPPTTGQVIMNGRVASLLEVGTGFNPELSGRENVYLNGMILGMSHQEIKKHFSEIVDFAEVGDFIDQPYKYFSSGMSMRLAFAVGAFLDPEILIVDEVLAVGDLAFQKKSLQRMQIASQTEGKTIIFVSHNLNAVENLCDQALYLDRGKIVEMGAVKKVVKDYGLAKINQIKERQNPSGIDLTTHPQKKHQSWGIQKVKIKVNQKNSQRITTADRVEIEFELQLSEPRKNLKLSLGIKNTWGESVLSFDNQILGQELSFSEAGEKTIKLTFPHWPLYGEGKYLVDLSLSYRNEVIELLNDAFYLEIFPRDIYQTGNLLNPLANVVPIKAEFEIKK